jgi:hypothetical protein
MHDIDTDFDELRRDVARTVTGPEAGQIIRRARRRTRIKVAAGAAAVVVAAGGFVAVREGGTGDRHVVTPPSPTASRSVTPRKLGLADLVYGEATRKDIDNPKRKQSDSGLWTRTTPANLDVPICSGDPSDEMGEFPATAQRIDVTYDGNPTDGNEMTSTERGEQVVVFSDVAAASRTMDGLTRGAESCRKHTEFGRLPIGDQAFKLFRILYDPADSPQWQDAVVVRVGKAIAIYWDLRNDGPKLVDTARHVSDARTMANRLIKLGYRG